MRSIAFPVTLLLALTMLLLTTVARLGHNHKHEAAHPRALVTDVVIVTEVVTKTITANPASVLSSSSSPVISSASPLKSLNFDAPAPSVQEEHSATPSDAPSNNAMSPFKSLATEPNSVSVHNSCDYDIYISSVGDSSCGPGADCKLVPAKNIHKENMRVCSKGGISLKISKSKDMSAPMQFEYTVWSNHEVVSYDISYLDCMKNGNGEEDLSACAGHDGGIQAVGGGDCEHFFCLANEWCSVNAYVVAEFGYKDGAPVGGCSPKEGIAFELCAGNRG